LLSDDKLGPVPATTLTEPEHAKNNLPDILTRWIALRSPQSAIRDPQLNRPRTAQSFCVPKADIVAQGYDLSISRYKEVVHEDVHHRPPREILADLAKLETEIQHGMKELMGMLK
jgi:type I restriction enzyme M protein